MHPDEPLDVMMVELAGALTRTVKAGDASRLITQAALDHLPQVDFASMCLARAGAAVRMLAPTNPRVLEADRLQHELSEGPCQDVMETSRAIRSVDLAQDARWPLYGPKVAASGINAQTTLPLPVSGDVRACLNLYSLRTGACGGSPVVTGLFATHAAVALGYCLQMHDLADAMERRKVIGQALGIVMERYCIDAEAAFAFLTRASQTANVKLHHVAEKLVAEVDERSKRRA